MRLVPRAAIAPMRCAVLPYIGQTHEAGFIDTGVEMTPSPRDQRVYVSVVAAKEMARMVGFVPAVEQLRAEAERDEALAELERLRADLAAAERNLEAVDLLESKGFTARKKPGRPRREEAAA